MTKASGITPWKNATRYCAIFCLLQDVLNRRLLFKTNRRQLRKGNHHPSFLRFWNWAEENCRCSQNLWRREKYLLNRNQQTFVNGLLGFITLNTLYSAGSACVLLTIIAWVAHRYGQLYLHCSINILLGSFQLFLVISLSQGEIIPFSGVRRPQSELHYPRRAAVVTHAATDRLLWCATDDDQQQQCPRRASFSALASANSFVYFASSAATSRWRICMSVIAAFASFSSLAFCRAGLCR